MLSYRLVAPLLLFAVCVRAAGPSQKSIHVDFDGDGRGETVTVQIRGGQEMSAFDLVCDGEPLRIEGAFATDADDFWPAMQAVPVWPGSKKQWLSIHGGGSGFTDATTCLIGMKQRALAVMASFKGAEVTVPGNATVLTRTHLGFWSRTVKWSISDEGAVQMVPQEFHFVNHGEAGEPAPCGVIRSFELLERREGKEVIARTRENSMVQIVLWQGSLPPAESRQLPPAELEKIFGEPSWLEGWYLIRSESGLLGWVKGAGLNKLLELPIQG